MPRDPIPSWFFAIVIVRRGDQFLLIHERKHGQHWYVPAGRVEPGESFIVAACREVLEESGIPVHLTGIVRFEHSPSLKGSRMRVVFVAEPLDDTPPKASPDDDSLGADWVRLEELSEYPLRGEEVREMFAYLSSGGPVYPLTILQAEGSPFLQWDW